ncbi:MAG: hypothetical protein L0287_15995 [Anaerolineae bacterium]|nr:hypothetical protein [Anaerolineae bacterium]MCI0607880.1 hypothetical protein [Anaerolineae bacterium]
MTNKFGFPLLCLILIVGILFSFNLKRANAIAQVNGKTLVLYDAVSGTIPATQFMNFIDFPPGAATPTYENSATVLNTTTSGSETYAGWVSNGGSTPGFPLLDRATGFQVNFSVQVENESHSNNNRAGFIMIILGKDARGIELAFWENELWVQNDDIKGGLFTHGEGAIFNPTVSLIDYQLTIANDTYTLTANGASILTGPLRDYSNFEGFPDPYQTPNFLFIGDNTTSAQARIRLGYVSVTGTEPISPTDTPSPMNSPTPSPIPTINDFESCPLMRFFAVTVNTSQTDCACSSFARYF